MRLPRHLREVVAIVVDELAEDLDGNRDDEDLRRLHPPAYLEDPDRDVEYQLLAGTELRSSQQQAVETTARILGQDTASEEELWALLRALNAVRLVVGTRLGIDDDEHDRPRFAFRLPAATARNWAIYDLTTDLQHAAVAAIGAPKP